MNKKNINELTFKSVEIKDLMEEAISSGLHIYIAMKDLIKRT